MQTLRRKPPIQINGKWYVWVRKAKRYMHIPRELT